MKAAQLIVVTGCHRSGTSCLARAVQTLGASLGDNLMPASPFNEKGYFENNRLVQINDAIFAALGHSWKTAASIDDVTQQSSDKLRGLRAEAADFLTHQLDTHEILALKDPRLCRLLPFWQRVFDLVGITPTIAISVRYPAAVAASLTRRDAMPGREGYELWHAYNADLLRGFDPSWEALFVDYGRLLDQPIRELARLSQLTGLPLANIPAATLQEFTLQFLDPKLSHATHWEPLPPGKITETWNMLSRMALT